MDKYVKPKSDVRLKMIGYRTKVIALKYNKSYNYEKGEHERRLDQKSGEVL